MEVQKATYLLCLDSDGQCDPKDFPKFWEARDTADVLIGWRALTGPTRSLRRVLSRFFRFFYQCAFRVPIHDPSCPFVLSRKEVILRLVGELDLMEQGFWWEYVARVYRRGYSLRELPVHHRLRAGGTTQVYKFGKMPGIFIRHVLSVFRILRETRARHVIAV